jgi:hypothetical protein
MKLAKKAALLVAAVVTLPLAGCDLIMESCTRELGFGAERATANLRVGETVQLSARAWSCGGKERVPVNVSWSTADSTVIQLSPSGEVKALMSGSATARGVDSGRYGAGPFVVPISVTE